MTREEFFDLCRAIGLLIGERDEERLYEALSGHLNWGKKKRKKPAPKAPVDLSLGQAAVGAYCDGFQARYGSKFKPSPMEGKLLKEIAQAEGQERAVALISAFFQMEDSWFVQKVHSVMTLKNDLNKVRVYLDSGKAITRIAAQQGERRAATAQALKDFVDDDDRG